MELHALITVVAGGFEWMAAACKDGIFIARKSCIGSD